MAVARWRRRAEQPNHESMEMMNGLEGSLLGEWPLKCLLCRRAFEARRRRRLDNPLRPVCKSSYLAINLPKYCFRKDTKFFKEAMRHMFQ